MTSKDSFNSKIYMHAFSLSLFQGFPVFLVSLTVVILLVPFSTAGIPDYSIFNLDYTHHQMLFRFFHENVTLPLNAAVILVGFILGIFQFKFLLIKRNSDAYLSMGIKRKKLFIINYTAGILLLFFIIIIPFSISFIFNILAFSELGGISLMLRCFIYVSAGFLLLSIISFTISSLSCCIAGTFFEAITFSSVMLGVPSIILYGINVLTKHLLLGNCFGASPSNTTSQITPGLLWKLSYLNPALFFYNASGTYSSNYVHLDSFVFPPINYSIIIEWAVISIILINTGILLINKRKAEIAGISGKNAILCTTCSAALSFLSFSVIVDMAANISILGAIAFGFITFVIIYIILQILILHSNERLMKALIPLPLFLILNLLIVVTISTGGLGFSNRIPDKSDIKSVEMTYVGSPNYINGNVEGTSNGENYYLLNSYTYTTLNDLAKITNLHKSIIEGGKNKFAVNSSNFENTTVPYDITIRYTLKNGKTLIRYYDRTTMKVLSELLALDSTTTVKKAVSDTISGSSQQNQTYWAPGAFKNGYTILSNSWYTNPQKINLGTVKRATLLNCIKKDVENQTLKDRYFSNKPPAGIIMFTHNMDNENLTFAYNLENTIVYVTDNFTNTIDFLKQNNLYQYFSTNVKIESITFQKYDPFVGINKNYKPQSQYFIGYSSTNGYQFIITKDFGKDLVIDDADKLTELSGLLCNDYFMSGGGYLASIKIADKDQYVYKFLPMQNAPQYIKNALTK